MRDFYLSWELTGFNLSRGWKNFEGGTHFYEKTFQGMDVFLRAVFTIALFPLWRVAGTGGYVHW